MGKARVCASGIFVALAGSLLFANEDLAPVPASSPIALVGGLIRTQTEAGDFVGTIVINGGKITAIGRDVAAPNGAQIINASNCVITPGLIDAHSMLWLQPGAARESGRDGTLSILDAIDPFADDWREVARQGVTAVYVQPNGSLGGAGAVLRVGPCVIANDLVLRSPASVQASLGGSAPPPPAAANPLADILARLGLAVPATPQAATPAGSNSLTRFAQYESLHNQFEAAKKYGENKPTRPDPAKELLAKAIKHEIPVRVEVSHEDDVRNALHLTYELGLKLAFEKIDRVKTLPEEIGSSRAGFILGPVLGAKPSAEIRKLAQDGRRWALGTFGDDPHASAWLRAHAAAAVADGYAPDKVLYALTRDAAELLGIADKAGSLDVDRTADLVVFAGDPLDPSVQVRMTISQGTITYDNPTAEMTPVTARRADLAAAIPDYMPASYVIKTTKLLNAAGEFVPGVLYIEAGKLTGRANNSPDVPIIDVGDAPVTPGLVAAHASLSNEESPDADASQLRAIDSVALDDGRIKSLREAGFFSAAIAPGSANVIAGTVTSADLGDPALNRDSAMKFVLTSAARNNERYPASLVGQLELIEGRLRGSPSLSNLFAPSAICDTLLSQRDAAIASVRVGRSIACFEVQTSAEVRVALRLIAEFKLQGVLVLTKPSPEIAGDLASTNVPVIMEPIRTNESDLTRRTLIDLIKAGTPLAFGGINPHEMRTTAAWLVNGGLPRSAARRGLIGQPTTRFGWPAHCGRLAPGDAADFVIWDGDPVDLGSKPVAVVARGQRIQHTMSQE